MKLHIELFGLICLLILSSCAEDSLVIPANNNTSEYGTAVAGKEVRQITSNGNKYLLYLPKEYDSEKEWPLVFFLHGSPLRGDSLSKLEGRTPAYGTNQFPFILVSPLCPLDTIWHNDLIEPIFQDVMKNYSINKNKITVTGMSMGAFGTVNLVANNPDRFAGYIPVAGGYILNSDSLPDNICDFSDVPAWFIHGAKDVNVLPIQSQQVVDALKECGGEPQFTLYPTADHIETLTKVYDDPETVIYEWLVQQDRSKQN